MAGGAADGWFTVIGIARDYLLYGIDPSATPVLTHVKERMAEFGQEN